ncbi:MAG: class I SAM-dependent methyltransferase [Gemmatimonadetes bacterium]|nr:class I SAM-dependent methyltransferase [Gemmatimonadota bacterium]
MWDARYGEPGYAYGTEPNDWLAAQVNEIPAGRVLSLADGEGRNGVFLATRGYDVTSVDSSPVGLAKAERLAASRNVRITTVVADLAQFEIAAGAWQGIVSIFVHLPRDLRRAVYTAAVQGLAPGGVFILEAYRPEQLRHGTGGPRSAALLPTLAELRAELDGLEFLHAAEVERSLHEGTHHDGLSAVVQIAARKPR